MRLLADENFNNDILRGLLRLYPDIDLVRVQDTHLFQKEDDLVLEWAASEDRILLTHDVKTMTRYAYQRVEKGLPMMGVIEVSNTTPLGQAIEEILVTLIASKEGELENRIIHIPLHNA
jgi:predicted nuclease of predicted toxin-antitoxin system